MKIALVAAVVCAGTSAPASAPAWAEPRHVVGTIDVAAAQGEITAASTPVSEGATGGRSGLPNQEQYKPKGRVKKAQ